MVDEIWNKIPITYSCDLGGILANKQNNQKMRNCTSGVMMANVIMKANILWIEMRINKKMLSMIAIGKWCIAIPMAKYCVITGKPSKQIHG
jgi:hypothetical protein